MFRRFAALGLLIGLGTSTASALSVSDGYLPVEPPATPTGTRTVASGDHFWSIAVEQLTAGTGQTPEEAEVAAYWRRLVAANLDGIRSGDADLIYPGEVVTLP